MDDFVKNAMLMFFLLNPFFMSIYLLDIINRLDIKTFSQVMLRSTLIAVSIFVAVAWAGDRIFQNVLHARFASFLIFGGIVFLVMGIRFVFKGHESLTLLRGKPEHLAGSIAMPFLIGPGTIMGSVLAGSNLPFPMAALSIVVSVGSAILCLVMFKFIFDHVKSRSEQLIQRYIMITGRVMALVIGTFAVEMILQGLELWLKNLKQIL